MEYIFQVIVSGLLSGGIYSLISVGLALIFGVVGVTNFAHGEYLMVAMYISYFIFTRYGIDPYQSMIFTLIFMSIIGYIIFRLIMKHVLFSAHEMQILITLGISLMLQNTALMLWKADFRSVRLPITTHTLNIGQVILSTPRIIAFTIAISASLLLYIFLQKTYTGTAMRAIAQNKKAAQLMGIKLISTYTMSFVIGIALVGLAGVLILPIYPVYPTIGNSFCTLAFIVVVLGGLSSVPGAILGGLLVGVIENIVAFYLGPAYQQASYFLLFIIVLVVKPSGILGKS